MKIYQEIKNRIEIKKDKDKSEYDNYIKFLSSIEHILSDNNYHLKQITAQLGNYDIHDEAHSQRVLENMELLLGDLGIAKLSLFELMLLFLSANLHDCAMALPNWEYKLLSSVEGTEAVFDRRSSLRINNDMQPPKTLKETIKFIKQFKKEIYGDFETVKSFLFAIKDENQFQSDLAKRIVDYENFRNRYTSELDKRINCETEYLNFSELIRSEYIRSTHHTRAVCFINSLKDILSESLGSTIATQMIQYLSEICRSHGENREFVFSLKYNEYIYGYAVNIQFLSIVLRLADAIHFSSDRAPLSLYAEKFITDYTSMQHWNAKFQELSYKIENQAGATRIKFSAFCDTPQIYYFINRYIEWINYELDNYHRHIKYLQLIHFSDTENYALPLDIKVDKSNILPNNDKFVPDHDLKFTLEQARILELLMGVQLYKDKYLCLRELYQNSLDACRCMQAENESISVKENFYIRFGISEKVVDGIPRKYIYCLDNGTGMTENIVKDHLLKIGNSYYKSRAFIQQNTNWSAHIKPTSQFGIGILSCYMISDKIEITTQHYSGGDKVFCLDLDGISENSYYIKPDDVEVEMIGKHGTLVKLFLKQEIISEINDDAVVKLPYIIHGRNNSFFNEEKQKKILERFKRNIFNLINSQVGMPQSNIKVEVFLSDNQFTEIIPWNKIFDYRNYPEITAEDIENLWREYHYLNGEENPFKEVLECRDYIKDIPITASNDNIELYTHISLPLKNIPTHDSRVFSFHKYIWKSEGVILIDGILVSDNQQVRNLINDYVVRECIINFIGKERPVLSIDRGSIVSISDDLKDQTKSLLKALPQKLTDALVLHMTQSNIMFKSYEAQLCIEAIMRKFPSLSTDFIYTLSKTEACNIPFNGIMNSKVEKTIKDLISEESLSFKDFDMRRLSELEREIIVGRLIPSQSINIVNNDVMITSKEFKPLRSDELHVYSTESLALSSVIIKADTWDGIYHEYDLVSNLWPIVSPNLYEMCKEKYEVCDINQGRSKSVAHTGNGLSGIAVLDPVMIHPSKGIQTVTNDPYRKKKAGFVGERGHLQEMYWLFELNNNGETVNKEKQDYILFAFIAPRELNEYEQSRLSDFSSDIDYLKGIKEGWSILFVGHEQKYYIRPGIVTREEMYNMIPPSIRKNKLDNISYYDTSGTFVF